MSLCVNIKTMNTGALEFMNLKLQFLFLRILQEQWCPTQNSAIGNTIKEIHLNITAIMFTIDNRFSFKISAIMIVSNTSSTKVMNANESKLIILHMRAP